MNDLLESTRESVWTCACPRLVESGIRAELERNGTITLAFGLKPALRSDYISHTPLPARSELRSHALVSSHALLSVGLSAGLHKNYRTDFHKT